MKVGLFGGTFNPPHKAHLRIAKEFIDQFGLDRLYICPANISYHKSSTAPLCAEHRLNMTKLAFKSLPKDKAVVSDMEIARGGNTYTIDTVNEILSLNKDCDKVYVLCGTDMINSLPGWYKAEELFQKSVFVHARRTGETVTVSGADVRELKLDEIEISSTLIRNAPEKYKEYLDDDVFDYISRNLLYHKDNGYDIEKLKKYAEEHEKHSRYLHTLAVKECALELKAHTAPQLSDDLVSAAALLHDCTKNCDVNDHFALFSTLDKPPSKEDLSSEKLFHSRTGAILARRTFGASDVMYNAIWRHTVGAEAMSVLDKIIFLADFIEKTRTYDECIRLRNKYYDGLANADSLIKRLYNLDVCVKEALELTISELKQKGAQPHSETVAALKYINTEIDGYGRVFVDI